MTIREKVAQAIYRADCKKAGIDPNWNPRGLPRTTVSAAYASADIVINAFLAAAAEQGWRMCRDEATEEMGEAWARLALDRIQRAVEGEMQTVGMVKGAKENYRAMLAAAPEFEWKK